MFLHLLGLWRCGSFIITAVNILSKDCIISYFSMHHDGNLLFLFVYTEMLCMSFGACARVFGEDSVNQRI